MSEIVIYPWSNYKFGGFPLNHPFLAGIVHEINQAAIGVAPFQQNHDFHH